MSRSSERSNSGLETRDLYRQSLAYFSGIAKTDPAELWGENGFRAFDTAMAIADTDIKVDSSVKELAKDGFSDIQKIVQNVFVASNFTGTLEQRVAFATHADSILTLGILAARNEEAMSNLISGVADRGTIVPAAGSGHFTLRHGTDGAASLATESRRCPFAGLYSGGEVVRPASAEFQAFGRWAAELAVYYDDPSYKKRHGLV